MIDLNNVFIHGRYNIDNGLHLYNTASGIEFNLFGKNARVVAKAISGQLDKVWMRVIIDNDEESAVDVKFGAELSEITLFSSEIEEKHNIKFMKVSEAIESSVLIDSIDIKGSYLAKPVYDNVFLSIGDSTVSAFGNLGKVDDIKTIDDTDGLKGFCYLSAKAFNASLNSLNGSGWGLSFSPWTIPQRRPLLTFYDKVAPIININYDLNKVKPKLVIISIGTNDYHYIHGGFDKNSKDELMLEFKGDYHKLLEKLNNDFPNVPIIMVHGVMKTTLNYDLMHQIFIDNKDLFNLYELFEIGDAMGVSTHPSQKSHEYISEKLISLIKEIFNGKN